MNWLKKYRAKQKLKQGQLPDFLTDYIDATENINKNTPIEEVSFVVFDTETTGLDPKKDKIISIGAVKVKNNQILYDQSFEALLWQENVGSKETTPIHQILSQDLMEASSEAEVLKKWLEFTKDAVLVAHHTWFDTQIVQNHLMKNFEVPLFNPSIDTMKLAQRTLGEQKHYDLDTLSQLYDISISGRHTAMGDALATAELFLYFVGHLKRRGNIKLKELL